MNWEQFVKRYIWDDDRTPYFVPVAKLNRKQADHEIFVYVMFFAILLSAAALVYFSNDDGGSDWIAWYAFATVVGAIIFGVTKHVYTAYFCSVTPAAVLLYFLIQGFPAHLGTMDHLVLIALIVVWMRYSVRIVNIAKAYPNLPPMSRS